MSKVLINRKNGWRGRIAHADANLPRRSLTALLIWSTGYNKINTRTEYTGIQWNKGLHIISSILVCSKMCTVLKSCFILLKLLKSVFKAPTESFTTFLSYLNCLQAFSSLLFEINLQYSRLCSGTRVLPFLEIKFGF